MKLTEEVKNEIDDDIAIGYTLATGRLFVDIEKFQVYAEELIGEPIHCTCLSNNFANEHLWDRMRKIYEEKRFNKLNNL
jgi:hypothetical protein